MRAFGQMEGAQHTGRQRVGEHLINFCARHDCNGWQKSSCGFKEDLYSGKLARKERNGLGKRVERWKMKK